MENNQDQNKKRPGRRIILVVIAILVIILIVFIVGSAGKKSSNIFSWNSITPGVTSTKEVISKLGQPLSTFDSAIGKSLLFNSESKSRQNEVVVNNDKVKLIKQVNLVNGQSFSDIVAKYGQPEIKLYGNLSDTGYYLFAYPSIGLAYYANPVAGNILEIWYFAPISQNVFVSTLAVNFSSDPSAFLKMSN